MKMNVESFNLDHTKVKAPYIRVADKKTGANGDLIVKYDVRLKQPNQAYMDMAALHSLEHLTAELIRNHADYIVDWSPMGCQTGFYLTVLNHDNIDEIMDVVALTMQGGWAANHTLEGAQDLAKEFLSKRDEWSVIFMNE
jgi:S-ribosylhomocysteine lyase